MPSLTIIAILLILIGVNSRFTTVTPSLGVFKRQKGWAFIDRMSFDEGLVSLTLNTKLKTASPPTKQIYKGSLQIIPELLWAEQSAFKCNRKIPSINLNQIDKSKIKPITILEIPIILRESTNFASTVFSQFSINTSITYHFVFKDCEDNITGQSWRRDSKLQLNLQLKNGELEHGSDEKINSFLLPLLIAMTCVMAYYSKRPSSQQFIEEQKDWAKIVLFIALILNLIAIILYWVGHFIYISVTGKFYGGFDFCYLMFHSLSESLLAGLLIFVAFGWTVTFMAGYQYDLYVPLMGMLGLINIILTLLGKINDGSSDKDHMYDSIPSYILVFFRLFTVLIFIIGIIKSYRQTTDTKTTSFFFTFGLIGGTYFLSLPVIMALAEFLPIENKRMFVFVTVEFIKNSINAYITWMISSKGSKYADVKFTNRSFMEKDDKLL